MRAILAMSIIGLAACSSSPDQPEPADGLDTSGEVGGEFFEITVNGLPCIVWIYQYDGHGSDGDSVSGLSCDWSER